MQKTHTHTKICEPLGSVQLVLSCVPGAPRAQASNWIVRVSCTDAFQWKWYIWRRCRCTNSFTDIDKLIRVWVCGGGEDGVFATYAWLSTHNAHVKHIFAMRWIHVSAKWGEGLKSSTYRNIACLIAYTWDEEKNSNACEYFAGKYLWWKKGVRIIFAMGSPMYST